MANSDLPFSAILNSLVGDYYHANRDISEKAEKLGQKISVRNIQRYRASKSVPQFATAKLLIEAAGGNIETEELKRSLLLERLLQKEEFEETEMVNIRITNSMMNEKLNKNDYVILDVIKERAILIYPDCKNPLDEYVCDLIAKDIYEDLI